MKIPFFFSDPWFEFRNANGSSPLNTKDVELLHNYAIQYLAIEKYKSGKTQFWNSAGPLVAIKPKLVAYLEGIDFRLKLLEEKPRLDFDKITTNVTVRGLFKIYQKHKSYQSQETKPQRIELAMDAVQCRVYGECSRAFAEKIDDSSEENIKALAALAVMELQFMHGCTVEWSRRDGEGGAAAGAASSSPQVLTSGSQGDDDDDEGHGGSGEGADAAGIDEFDFTQINCDKILTTVDWSTLDYGDATEFVTYRECLALATVFFLCEVLGDKFPKLRDQVHAGWMHAIKEPISLDLLIDPPSEIDFEFTDEEEEWRCQAMQLFVGEMPEEKREALGITLVHLEMLKLEPQKPVVSPNPCHDALPSAATLPAADGSSLPQASRSKATKTGRATPTATAASRAAASPAAASGVGDRPPPRKRGAAAAPAHGDASASPAASAARHTRKKVPPSPPPPTTITIFLAPTPTPTPSPSLRLPNLSYTPIFSAQLGKSGPPRARYRVHGRGCGPQPGQQVTVRCSPQAQRHRK